MAEEEALEGLQSYEELQANLQEYTAQLQQVWGCVCVCVYFACSSPHQLLHLNALQPPAHGTHTTPTQGGGAAAGRPRQC